MVAQVGAPEAAAQQVEGQHEVPVDAGVGEPALQGPEVRVLHGADVVEQEADVDAALHGPLHRLEDGAGGLVPRHGVDFDVDVGGGGVDKRCKAAHD